MRDRDPWFRRKRFGLGYAPSTCQGWAITVGYVAVGLALNATLRRHHPDLEIALVTVMTIGLVIIGVQHSDDDDGRP